MINWAISSEFTVTKWSLRGVIASVSSDAWVNSGLAEKLYSALRRCGTVTIRLADLGPHAGLTTDFRRGEIALDHTLDFPTFLGTITHELTHLRRGPVPEQYADAEEIAVRHETAEALLPALKFAARHRDTVVAWTEEQTRAVADFAQVDYGVVRDAIFPPTMPMPIVPAAREASDEDAA